MTKGILLHINGSIFYVIVKHNVILNDLEMIFLILVLNGNFL